MITLDLPQKTEQALIEKATAKGMSVEDWATAILTANAHQQPSYANGDFDYDLERMKDMMDCKFVPMPKGAAKDLDSFEKWLAGAFS